MEKAVTCVSCFYQVTNKHSDAYLTWFRTTLRVTAPYVIFGTKETIEIMRPFRNGLPTLFMERNIEDFVTNIFKDKILTHPLHCPSIDLGLIWNEKIFMVHDAAKINPFNTQFFAWIDAGICVYRDAMPPSLPFQTTQFLDESRFNYTSSMSLKQTTPQFDNHHISGTYVVPAKLVPLFANLYFNKLKALDFIETDQVVLTHLYLLNPNLFHCVGDGYGTILFNFYQRTKMKLIFI